MITQPEDWKAGFTEDRKKFRFLHNAHRFTLFKRDGSPYWQVKVKHKGRQVAVSLGTTLHDAAKKRAMARYDEMQSGEWFKHEEAVQPPAPVKPWATLGQIVDRYQDGVAGVNTDIADTTVNANAANLLRFARTAWPELEDPRDCSIERFGLELAPASVAAFRRNYLLPAGDDVRARESRKRGGNSVLRLARAVFSRAAMPLYQALRMPDLSGWMKAPGFDAKRALVFEIPRETMGRMAVAALELRELRPALYLAHLLFRHGGCRNVEIAAMRWSWLQPRPEGGGWMVIDQTAEFDAKGSLGRVPIAAEVWQVLEKYRRQPEDFVLDLPTKTERKKLVDREHSNLVRPFLDGSSKKTSYRLRKWSADTIRRKYGDDASRAFLRHAEESVAGQHYWSGYDWTAAAKRAGESPADAGITFADAGLPWAP